MNLYSDEVKKFIFGQPWPSGLIIDIYEATEPLPHLNFVFYRDNFIKFSSTEQARIAAIVKEVIETLRSQGIPCFMGRMSNVPRR